jgi:hypothetical protein
VLRPGTARFEEIDKRGSLGVYLLPRRNLTIVTSNKGSPLIVGDRTLAPWLSQEELSLHGVSGVYNLHDAPSLNATIVLDLDRRIHVLTDDDQWHSIARLGKDETLFVVDAPASKGALLVAHNSVMFVRRDSDGAGFHADTLKSGPSYGAGWPFPVSRLFGQVLAYTSGGLFDPWSRWRRLTPAGFEAIAGGDIGLPAPGLFPYGLIEDLSTIGRTLIEGRDGFFLYDGEKMTPVAGGDRRTIGGLPRVYDLPSIGRVVVTTRNGMFELTKEGTLAALSMPFPAHGLHSGIETLPEARARRRWRFSRLCGRAVGYSPARPRRAVRFGPGPVPA